MLTVVAFVLGTLVVLILATCLAASVVANADATPRRKRSVDSAGVTCGDAGAANSGGSGSWFGGFFDGGDGGSHGGDCDGGGCDGGGGDGGGGDGGGD
jgi:hypothetical protein